MEVEVKNFGLRQADAARMLGVSHTRVWQLVKMGRLRVIDGRILIGDLIQFKTQPKSVGGRGRRAAAIVHYVYKYCLRFSLS